MEYLGLAHPAFYCKHYEETLRFYTQRLHLRVQFDLPLKMGGEQITVTNIQIAKGQLLELFPMPYPSENLPSERAYHHFCLRVWDLSGICQELLDAGYPLRHAPADGSAPLHSVEELTAPGLKVPDCVYLSDPEGNDVELQQQGKLMPREAREPDEPRFLSHIGLKLNHFEETLSFYERILGFRRLFTFPYSKRLLELLHPTGFTEGIPRGAFLEIAEGQYLEFFNEPFLPRQVPEYSYMHLCVLVSDIEQAARELEEKGVRLYRGPKYLDQPQAKPYRPVPGPAHSLSFYIQDPEGNEIEFMQYTKKSLQLSTYEIAYASS